jgi:hypothetical protein
MDPPVAAIAATAAAHVMYVDHAGHPAPLSECYHATASRRLASSVHRYPASTTYAELESAYCPHCLACHDGPAASRSPHCSRPTCQVCPVCLSATSIVTGRQEKTQESKESGNNKVDDAEEDPPLLVHYRCGNCEWTSLECDLFVIIGHSSLDDGEEEGSRPAAAAGGGVDRLQLARAAEDLVQTLNAARQSYLRGIEQHCAEASKHWESVRRSSTGGTGTSHPRGSASWQQQQHPRRERTLRQDPSDPIEGWSVSALESKLQAKKEEFSGAQNRDKAQEPFVERVALSDGPDLDLDDLTIDDSLRELSVVAFQLQALHNGLGAGTGYPPPQGQFIRRKDLLPLPIKLRPRKSRRCRAELREGRAGILLKPRLNPLEGDSSLRSGHGQWWKKDSSAIHVIPSVTVVRCVKTTWEEKAENATATTTISPNPSTERGAGDSIAPRSRRRIAVLLKVTNPTLGSLRLRFAASPYVGEPDWDSVGVDGAVPIAGTDPNQFTDSLPGLLVHTFTQAHWDVEYDSGVLRDLPASETVELHSSEDSIIEMGGHKARQTPPEVVYWEPPPVVASTDEDLTKPVLRLVTHRASSAWFELAFVEPARFCEADETAERARTHAPDKLAWAVSLRLEVEVGPGSWETSLIPPLSTGKSDATSVDRVPFDLVLAYQ